ncbi:MAG TPA: hypothetical protein VMG30_14390 [Acidobacteriota bacterium]|nr:hypothetical protein [Acidobacteriota bacterium]
MNKMFTVLLVVTLLLPAAAIAGDADNHWTALKSIPAGQLLAVKTFSGKNLKGSLQHATDSIIGINANGKDLEVPVAEVSRVYVLRGRPIMKATLIGAAVGTAAGAGFGALAGRDSHGWFLDQGSCTAIGAGLGLVAGSVTGLLIGTSRHNRVLIYKATRDRR